MVYYVTVTDECVNVLTTVYTHTQDARPPDQSYGELTRCSVLFRIQVTEESNPVCTICTGLTSAGVGLNKYCMVDSLQHSYSEQDQYCIFPYTYSPPLIISIDERGPCCFACSQDIAIAFAGNLSESWELSEMLLGVSLKISTGFYFKLI